MNNNNIGFPNNLNPSCLNHLEVQANYFCLSDQCKENRLACQNCFDDYHSSHQDLTRPIVQLTLFLEGKSQQAEEFLKNYFNQFKQLQQMFNRTIKALQYTFANCSNQLQQMDQSQIILLLNQLITYDSFNQFLGTQVVDKLQKMNEIQSQILQTLPLHQITKRLSKQLAQNLINFKKYGFQLMNSNQYGQAITLFDKVLEKNPYDIEALLKKGECLMKQNFYYEAQHQFEEILYFDPHNLEAMCEIGNCLFKCNKYDEALIQFQMCLKTKSNSYMALLGHADCLRKMNKLQEAINQYEKAIRVNQQGYAAFCGQAECLKLLNDLNKSQIMYRRALQIVENHFDSLFGLGRILNHFISGLLKIWKIVFQVKRLKKYYEAIPFYDKALEINLQHSGLLEGKGYSSLINQLRVYKLLMNFYSIKYCANNIEAVEFYQLALEYDPSLAEALKGLGYLDNQLIGSSL